MKTFSTTPASSEVPPTSPTSIRIYFFTSDNRFVKVYTRSIANKRQVLVNGKAYYFDRKFGTLDLLKSYKRNKPHGYSIIYNREGKIVSARKF